MNNRNVYNRIKEWVITFVICGITTMEAYFYIHNLNENNFHLKRFSV